MSFYILIGTNFPEVVDSVTFIVDSLPDTPSDVIFLFPDDLNPATPKKLPDFASPYADLNSAVSSALGNTSMTFFMIPPSEKFPDDLQILANQFKAISRSPERVILYVDCEAAEKSESAQRFFEAAAWYADVVLLGNRNHASKKFVRDFEKSFQSACYPSLFAFLKKDGKVDDPMAVLFPEPRRLSQMFDLKPSESEDSPFLIIDASCDLDDDSDDSDDYDPFQDPDPDAPNLRVPPPDSFIVRFP